MDKSSGINDLLSEMAEMLIAPSMKSKPTCGRCHKLWYSNSRQPKT